MEQAATGRRRRGRRWLVVGGLAALALGAWVWKARSTPLPPPASAAVEAADIEQVVLAAGRVRPSMTVDIGAQVTGQVHQLHVTLGQHVRKGELLVSLDPALARSDVQQAEASAAQQSAALQRARVDLAQAEREHERQQKMLRGDATPRAEAERAADQLAKLRADVQSAQAQLDKIEADLAKARLNLGFTQVAAPIDGEVVSIAVQEGQTVNAQQQSPTLLTLAKLDPVTIWSQVPEADIARVHLGQEASFATVGDPEHRYRGQLRAIQPVADVDRLKAGSGVFYNVLFDVPNPQRKLMSDMSVQVSLSTAKASKALAIPVAALGDKAPDGRYTVQVLSATGARETRPVRVGITDAARAEVLGGLKAGERVVLAPVSSASASHP
jgi:macrolide-specific efflux system membrane fusion protein